MIQKLAWWWLYESKHVATFIIDNKISCVLTELNLEYYKDLRFSNTETAWTALKNRTQVGNNSVGKAYKY